MTETSTDLRSQARGLIRDLQDSRRRELEVLSGLTPEQILGSKMRIIEPPIWEMGHVGWFQELWTLRRLDGAAPIFTGADALYNSFSIPNAERWDLSFPSYKATLAYLTEVLEQNSRRLERADVTAEDLYFTRLAINHED